MSVLFTFPGQGSQKPGMGEAWREHPSWELVVEASSVLGRDLEGLLLHTDADELKLTDNAQLSTFLTSLVVLDAVGHCPHLSAPDDVGIAMRDFLESSPVQQVWPSRPGR